MSRLADLGWQMARCTIDGLDAELELFEPESETNEAKSMRITGLEGLLALRDLIDDAVKDAEETTRRNLAEGG